MEPSPADDASDQAPAPQEPLLSLLVFRVGAVWYGAQAQRVRSVVGATTTVRVPGTPAFVAGVASVAGRIAVVLELSGLLGRTATPGQAVADRLVLFDVESSVVAVLTDEVAGVTSVTASQLQPLAGESGPAIKTFTDGDRHVTVIDLDRMIEVAEDKVRQRGEA
ncbi:MAG: chemotaxis protein CheW [Archangiaceae bacterium]|nr:chemotaxis protein CheW [Archangiaceae bacterium]